MKIFLGLGAILLAILIVLTLTLNLPESLHYAWAALAFIWGILILTGK